MIVTEARLACQDPDLLWAYDPRPARMATLEMTARRRTAFRNEITRFWSKVDRRAPDECWEWQGSRSRNGYGRFALAANTAAMPAHRYGYELMNGPVPAELVVDHLCFNPPCVNPGHLEPVTQRVNVLRGHSPTAVTYLTGICKWGHRIEGDNLRLYYGPDGRLIQQVCQRCRQIRRRRYYLEGRG